MTSCTPVYGFPFPTGADAPCVVNDSLCDLVTDVETQLDVLDTMIGRTITSVPQAQVRLTVSSPGGGASVNVSFDTVDVDTDNMVDLTVNPYIITLPVYGRYYVYFSATGVTTGGTTSVIAQVNSPTNLTAVYDMYQDDSSTPFYICSSGYVYYVPAFTVAPFQTTSPQLFLSINFPVSDTVTAVTFGAAWTGDLP